MRCLWQLSASRSKNASSSRIPPLQSRSRTPSKLAATSKNQLWLRRVLLCSANTTSGVLLALFSTIGWSCKNINRSCRPTSWVFLASTCLRLQLRSRKRRRGKFGSTRTFGLKFECQNDLTVKIYPLLTRLFAALATTKQAPHWSSLLWQATSRHPHHLSILFCPVSRVDSIQSSSEIRCPQEEICSAVRRRHLPLRRCRS